MSFKFVILLALGCATLGLAACSNTLEGAGRDLESWGKGLQDTF